MLLVDTRDQEETWNPKTGDEEQKQREVLASDRMVRWEKHAQGWKSEGS